MTAIETFIFVDPQTPGEDVPVFRKQAADTVQLEAKFKNSETANPYTLTEGACVVLDSAGVDVSADMLVEGSVVLNEDEDGILATITGGSSGEKYVIHFDGTSEENPVMRGSVKLRVKDVVA